MTERQVRFSRQFTRDFKRLQKRFRHISSDLNTLLDQLKQGDTPGDQVSGVGRRVYKVRLQNRDTGSGKSGGYRVIYYLATPQAADMVTIYYKGDRENITVDELRRLIAEVEAEFPHE